VRLLRPLHLHELEALFDFLRRLEVKAIGTCCCYKRATKKQEFDMRQRAGDAQSCNLISWRIDSSDSDVEVEVEDNVVAVTYAGVLRNIS
jgi:hypothetical protein